MRSRAISRTSVACLMQCSENSAFRVSRFEGAANDECNGVIAGTWVASSRASPSASRRHPVTVVQKSRNVNTRAPHCCRLSDYWRWNRNRSQLWFESVRVALSDFIRVAPWSDTGRLRDFFVQEVRVNHIYTECCREISFTFICGFLMNLESSFNRTV